ncbi:hypothetical protein EsDP_00002792 [Epichloe bromicola]|uniref:Uncharacterized protein n=1 Tax=Epichloe bromicola TaxID=79588 RepID=A0ABQ0CLV5_9HYPO
MGKRVPCESHELFLAVGEGHVIYQGRNSAMCLHVGRQSGPLQNSQDGGIVGTLSTLLQQTRHWEDIAADGARQDFHKTVAPA